MGISFSFRFLYTEGRDDDEYRKKKAEHIKLFVRSYEPYGEEKKERRLLIYIEDKWQSDVEKGSELNKKKKKKDHRINVTDVFI